jgi:hypothetical protein
MAAAYAIRNIVAEARRVEAQGTTVRYLNIGDPSPSDSDFAHLIEPSRSDARRHLIRPSVGLR